METQIRALFNESQHLHKHDDSLKKLLKLEKKSSADNFYTELIRDIKLALHNDPKSPFTRNIIEFIIKFMIKHTPSSGENQSPNSDASTHMTLFDSITRNVIIPYLYSVRAECRVNTCTLIRKLFNELDDIDDRLYDSIKNGIIDRCADKNSTVRTAAIMTLHRLQDTGEGNDIVMDTLRFHLKNDPDADVRQACVLAIEPRGDALSDIKYATRDVKDFIRKTAFTKIADEIPIKRFTIEQRIQILNNGLNDRSAAVKKSVELKLIPSWIKSCDNDLNTFLQTLDVQSDVELVEKVLSVYFHQLLNEKLDSNDEKSKFHQCIDQFRDKYLDDVRLLTHQALTVEDSLLWVVLANFCKENKISTKIEKISIVEDKCTDNEVTEYENIICGEVMDVKDINDDRELIDLLIPDVPHYCAYLKNVRKKFIENITQRDYSDEDLAEFEFMYNQLMRLSLLFEINDDVQKKILTNTMKSILVNDPLQNKFHSYVNPIMKCLSINSFKDGTQFLEFTVGIISEINWAINESTHIPNDTENGDDSTRYTQLKSEIDDLKEQLTKAVLDENDPEADDIKGKITKLTAEANALKDMQFASQSSQMSHRELPSLKDHPNSFLRCLHIFSGCLEFGKFSDVNAVMQTHIEKLILEGILNENESLREIAVKCLGLVFFISSSYTRKYMALMVQVLSVDTDDSVKIMALQSIFDALCQHGLNLFDNNERDNKMSEQNKQLNNHNNQSEGERSESSGNFTQSDDTDDNPDDGDNDDDIMPLLTQLFEDQLDSTSDEIKYLTAQGIAKLLILGKMYSAHLLSKLIIIWYNSNENQRMLQFIGDFLRIYAYAEAQGVIIGQSALEEAFIMTLECVHRDHIEYINREKIISLINFLLNLIVEESHSNLAVPLATKIVNLPQSERVLADDFLIPALAQLNLIEMESRDLNQLEEFYEQIRSKFGSSKNAAKHLTSLRLKIDDKKQHIEANAAFEGDFASVDGDNDADDKEDNNDTDLSMTMNSVNITDIDNDNCKDDDTDDSEDITITINYNNKALLKRNVHKDVEENDIFDDSGVIASSQESSSYDEIPKYTPFGDLRSKRQKLNFDIESEESDDHIDNSNTQIFEGNNRNVRFNLSDLMTEDESEESDNFDHPKILTQTNGLADDNPFEVNTKIQTNDNDSDDIFS